AVLAREMPRRDAPVLRSIVRPPEDGAAKVCQRHPQVLLIPGRQRGAIPLALEKDAANSSDLCQIAFPPGAAYPRSAGAASPCGASSAAVRMHSLAIMRGEKG